MATAKSGVAETEAPAEEQAVVTLATPMSIGTLHDSQDRFPDITDLGTALSQKQADAAEAVAKAMHFQFRVIGEDKRKKEGGN